MKYFRSGRQCSGKLTSNAQWFKRMTTSPSPSLVSFIGWDGAWALSCAESEGHERQMTSVLTSHAPPSLGLDLSFILGGWSTL